MRIEFYKTRNLLRVRWEWRWKAVHNNGQIMANGAESYVRLVDCEQAVRTLTSGFIGAPWHYPDGFKLAHRSGHNDGPA